MSLEDIAAEMARNFLFMDLGYEDEEEFEDASWHHRSEEFCATVGYLYSRTSQDQFRSEWQHNGEGSVRVKKL